MKIQVLKPFSTPIPMSDLAYDSGITWVYILELYTLTTYLIVYRGENLHFKTTSVPRYQSMTQPIYIECLSQLG